MSFKNIENDGSVVLRKFDKSFRIPLHATVEWKNDNADNLRTAVVIDLETTGLDCAKDKVIEIGIRSFKFDRRNGDIIEIGQSYNGLQDPKEPLNKVITDLTGITDADLKDQCIDWASVNEIFDSANVVIAHKADFERSFIDQQLPESSSKIWACSLSQVDWTANGFKCHKLEVLSYYHGFFVEFHRAMNDVDALIHLLSFNNETNGKSYLNELLEAAKVPRAKILAFGSPFESKDLLRTNGYSWNSKTRVWWKSSPVHTSLDETKWLEEYIYFGPFRGEIQTLRLNDTFKSNSVE